MMCEHMDGTGMGAWHAWMNAARSIHARACTVERLSSTVFS